MGYQLIETVTVGSGGAASIEFTGIPQDGVDLVVKLSWRRSDSSLGAYLIEVNGSSIPSVQSVRLEGTGSAASSNTSTLPSNALVPGTSQTSNTFGSWEFYLPNYTSSTRKSSMTDSVTENNGTTSYQQIIASSFGVTSPVTSLKFAGSPDAGTTASLYKITA
jgi:hypothetical protein